MVAESDDAWAALGNRLAAEIYGCEILRAGVEDVPENETRFVWLARSGPRSRATGRGRPRSSSGAPGDDAPGWLVRCLSEFAFRGVNLTKIESRPRKQGLGRYMFFADLEGRTTDRPVAEGIEAVRGQAEVLPAACGAHYPESEPAGSWSLHSGHEPWPFLYHLRHPGSRRPQSTSGAGRVVAGCSS